MPIGPRPLRDLFDSSSTLDGLLTRVRRDKHLLMQIQGELPQPLDQHCHAVLAKGPTLLLFTDSPAWASRLRFFARELGERLHRRGLRFGRITVRVLIFDPPQIARPAVARQLSSANAVLLHQVAESITDPQLRDALNRLSKAGR